VRLVLTYTEEETEGEEGSYLDLSDREEKEVTPTRPIKSEVSWTPSTISRKTDTIIQELTTLRQQLSDARMAKQTETSMTDLLARMMKMQTDSKQKALDREERRFSSYLQR